MESKTALFYIFSTVLLFAAFMVITAKNMVHAALYLVLSFFQAAAIWVLLKSEFLALSLVLVYVGAVMVLFLFVVMMLDINMASVRDGFWKHFPLAATLGAIVAIEMIAVLLGGFRVSDEPKAVAAAVNSGNGGGVVAQYSNTKELGKVMYSAYIYPVQIAAVILLVAIIAAIALTLRERKDSKYASPSEQVRVKASDRMVVVKIDPTIAPPTPNPTPPDPGPPNTLPLNPGSPDGHIGEAAKSSGAPA